MAPIDEDLITGSFAAAIISSGLYRISRFLGPCVC